MSDLDSINKEIKAARKETRNSKVLSDFNAYCEAYPDQRFWQALRNWAGVGFIYTSDSPLQGDIIDTFYKEGK